MTKLGIYVQTVGYKAKYSPAEAGRYIKEGVYKAAWVSGKSCFSSLIHLKPHPILALFPLLSAVRFVSHNGGICLVSRTFCFS